MKTTIACPGRFHVGDLARELIKLGHDVRFHSIVPPSRLEALGIPRAAQSCHLGAVWPWVLAQRKLNCSAGTREWLDLKIVRTLDRRYSQIRHFGDVFIAMSGLCLESLKAAKRQGARVILERGSMHILSQKEILDCLRPDSTAPSTVPAWAVERELEGYELADVISIASRHVEDSFLLRGFDSGKLVRNTYGVDLNAFQAKPKIAKTHDVITTGTWCLGKGSDILAKAVLERVGASLLHVGALGDCELPRHKNFLHVDAVPQNDLANYYAKARIFALPSHQEGLSMVQAQALAAGLPVIGSTHSGSVDLAELLGLGAPQIQSVRPGDVEGLVAAIKCAMAWLPDADAANEFDQKKTRLSWAAYGLRYHEFLTKVHSND
jgi:starch synthase